MTAKIITARAGYRQKLADGTLTIGDIELMLQAWQAEVDDLNTSADAAAERDHDRIGTLEDQLQDEVDAHEQPPFGVCRRGCGESYLNREGYCSPSCAMGGAKGKLFTPLGQTVA